MTALAALFAFFQAFLATPQWRVVYLDGSVGAFRGEPKVAQARRGEVLYGWVWSELAPPGRVEAAKLGDVELAPARGRLEVRVIPPAGKTVPQGLRVLAGPIEMWRELPEEELPGWSVPSSGRLSIPTDPAKAWRLRLAGEGTGSWWTDVAAGTKSVLLAANRAEDFARAIVGPDGSPLHGARIVLSEGTVRAKIRGWATYRSEKGQIRASGLPDARSVLVTVQKPGMAPAVYSGRLADLPDPLRLAAGARVNGRLADRRGRPIAGAEVRVETWISRTVPQVFSVSAASGPDGTFEFDGLPLGPAVVLARLRGFAPVEKSGELAAGANDFGALILEPGVGLAVAIRDERGEPIPGAEVETAGTKAETDAAGLARFAGLPARDLTVAARARGHLETRQGLSLPFPREVALALRRAFTVTGRLLDRPGGAPVADGALRIEQENGLDERRTGGDGRFSLTLKPEIDAVLVFASSHIRELRLPVARGGAGETRDLGDLAPPSGLAVVGRVVHESDGSPVAGASLWLPRPGPMGPAWAWATRDLLRARTGEDGSFRLAGLSPGAAVLRAEAPGLARAHVEVALPEGTTADVGEIRLSAGGTVLVLVSEGEEAEGAVARADLRGAWLDPDMIVAPVLSGAARLRNLPPGPVTISVLAGYRLLCERPVRVESAVEEIVDCRRKAPAVTGLVRMGGEPVAGGVLTFLPPAVPDVPARIDRVVSPAGLSQHQVFGLGRPQIDVPVGGDGTFVTSDLTPGSYTAIWSPSAGEASPELPVVIPEVVRYEVVVDLPGQLVRGRVVDREGRPAAGARVTELGSGALAFAGDDGAFSLTGLRLGPASFVARRDEQTSEVVELDLAAGRPAELLVLTLGQSRPLELTVTVLDERGRGVPGAFVFLEEEGKGQRILTTGADGTAAAEIEAPLPQRLRAAATSGSSWGFAPWQSLTESRSGLTLGLLPAGTLVLAGTRNAGALRLETRGFDLSWLLTQLGTLPRVLPEGPTVLSGMPAGDFTLRLGQASRRVRVVPGETVRVELD